MATITPITRTLTLPDMTLRYPPVGSPPDGYVLTYVASDGYYIAKPQTRLLIINTVSSTPYNMSSSPEDLTLVSHAAAFVVNLPTSPLVGTTVFIKDFTGNAVTFNITINGGGGQLIDGAASYAINTNYGCVKVTFTGSAWSILDKF
jgi:hypothetical protein